MASTFEELLRVARAGARAVHIASHEWERVQGHVIGLANELGIPMRVWSYSSGLRAHVPGVQASTSDFDDAPNLNDPLELLPMIREASEPGVWLLEDIHPYFDHHEVVRWLRELTRLPAEPRKLLVLSTPTSSLPLELRKEVATLELALPGEADLKHVLETVSDVLNVSLTPSTALIDAARGLTVMEARLAFGKAAVELKRLDHSAVPLVAREKERVIKQTEVLEYYQPNADLADVGGLEALKTWLERRGRAFGEGAKEFGLDAPKGVMLLGVQGCGKSLTAKAIAAAWQFPLLRFDMGKVFGGIVGQSEGNIRSALQVAEALAPCVLWIDEIEKGLSGMASSGSTDGGTTARVVGTLLTWMQEKRAPVFVVATANRIDMLPPELLRKGRFDEIFFVDLPSEAVRREILGIHLTKKGRDPADYDLDALASAAIGFSGAELEEAVREGLYTAFAEGEELATEHIASALTQTFPLSRTMHEEIDGLRQWARVRARLAANAEPEALPVDSKSDGVPRLKQEMSRNPFIPERGKS